MWGYGKDIIRGFSLVTAIYGPIAKVKEIVKTASSNEILEKFYRAMSQKEYNKLIEKGRISVREKGKGNSYLGITQSEDYAKSLAKRKGGSRKYPKVVQFEVKAGTSEKLLQMRATHSSAAGRFPNLPKFESGMNKVQIKFEKSGVLSFGIGTSEEAVILFNESMYSFNLF